MTGSPLSIAFAVAEMTPLATTGGLGDVAAALPRALAALGHRVAVFLPLYRAVRSRGAVGAQVAEVHVPGFDPHPHYRVFSGALDADGAGGALSLLLVEHDRFFDRPGIYGESFGEYGDNLERFSFFCSAVLASIAALDLRPDVIHAHDWHTALVPALRRTTYAAVPAVARAGSLFTIHNLAFHGRFPANRLPTTRLPWEVFHPGAVEFWGDLDLMKAGIVFADVVTTVSERYAREITTPEFGEGLDGVLRSQGDAVVGIRNGIDVDRWNPATDPLIAANYSASDLSGKRRCRDALAAELGLSVPDEAPIVGVVSRLTRQKGADLVLGAADAFVRVGAPRGPGAAFVLLGSGEPALEAAFRDLAARHPGRVAVRIGFDEALAHRIEAGADVFLMPSRWEPCGLNQMYSLRYGTLPVVRATGGLDDTVRDVREADGNGFKFVEATAEALLATVARALSLHRNRSEWRRVVLRGMSEDFSWLRSAVRYVDAYGRAALMARAN